MSNFDPSVFENQGTGSGAFNPAVFDPGTVPNKTKGVNDKEPIRAFLSEFGQSVGPATGAGIGSAVAYGGIQLLAKKLLTGAAAGAIGGPVGAGIGAISTGMTLYPLLRKAQESMMSPETVQNLQQLAQKDPVATTAGNLAANFMVPTIGGLGNMASGAGKIAKGLVSGEGAAISLTSPEKQQLLNYIVNSAFTTGPVAAEIAGKLQRGEDVTKDDLARLGVTAAAATGTHPVLSHVPGLSRFYQAPQEGTGATPAKVNMPPPPLKFPTYPKILDPERKVSSYTEKKVLNAKRAEAQKSPEMLVQDQILSNDERIKELEAKLGIAPQPSPTPTAPPNRSSGVQDQPKTFKSNLPEGKRLKYKPAPLPSGAIPDTAPPNRPPPTLKVAETAQGAPSTAIPENVAELAGQHGTQQISVNRGQTQPGIVNVNEGEMYLGENQFSKETPLDLITKQWIHNTRQTPEGSHFIDNAMAALQQDGVENPPAVLSSLVAHELGRTVENAGGINPWQRVTRFGEEMQSYLRTKLGTAKADDFIRIIADRVRNEVTSNPSIQNRIATQFAKTVTEQLADPTLMDYYKYEANHPTRSGVFAFAKNPVIPSVIDNVRKLGPEGNYIGDRLNALTDYSNQFGNKLKNKVFRILEPLTPGEQGQLRDILFQERDTKTLADINSMSPKLARAYTAYRKNLRDYQIRAKERGDKVVDYDSEGKPFLRDIGDPDPFYMYSIMDPKVRDIMRNGSRAEVNEVIGKMADYVQMKTGLKDRMRAENIAEDILRERVGEQHIKLNAPRSDSGLDDLAAYRARRVAASIGLPKELTEPTLVRASERYAKRVGMDDAFRLVIESDPYAMAILDIPDQNGVVPVVRAPGGHKLDKLAGKTAVQQFFKLFNLEYLRDDVSTRFPQFVNATIVQSPSRVVDNLTGFSLALIKAPLHDTADAKAIVLGLKDLFANPLKTWEEAFKSGFMGEVPKLSNNIEMMLAEKDASDRIYNLTRFLNRVTGSWFMESVSHLYSYAIMRRSIPIQLAKAAKGDKEAIQILKDLKINRLNPSEQEITRALIVFDRTVTGNYTTEAQPAGILIPNRWLSWSYGLMKYSISMQRELVRLANRRDYMTIGKMAVATPLLFLGMDAAWQMMFGKSRAAGAPMGDILKNVPEPENKSFIDRLGQALEDPNLRQATLDRIFGVMAMSGMWGGALEFGYMAYSSKFSGRQGDLINVPAVDYLNQLAADTYHAFDAWRQGDADMLEVMGQYLQDSALNRSQLTRLFAYQWSKLYPKGALGQKFNDRERRIDTQKFEQVTGVGNKMGQQAMPRPNYYKSIRERELERSIRQGEMGQAGEIAGKMAEKYRKDLEAGKMPTMAERKSRLNSLASPVNNIEPTMNDPEAFIRFQQFMTRTYGPDEAKKAMDNLMASKLTSAQKKAFIIQAIGSRGGM